MSEALGQQNNQVPTDAGEADLTDTSPARGAGPNARVVPAGPGNVVTLPADAVIEEVSADGRDLVITLQDGTQIVIPDGAIVLPQLLVGNTPIPPANLAALLVDGEPEPAAGNTPSSGGDFFVDPGDIQSAFDIGDLLPYTELTRSLVQDQEIIPQPIDRDPDITIEPDDSGVSVINAEDAVNEAGLPEGVPPARGAGEPEGTDSASNSEDTFGFINFSSPDGTSSISLNGVEIDLDGNPIGQTFTTDLGILTIVSVEPGRIGYTYKLLDNTTDPTSADFFTVTITDPDGDTATATLRIDIIDDAPIGLDDEGTVPAGSHAEITGNVLTNDIPGADNFPVNAGVTGFSQGEETAGAGGSIHGAYGTLVLNANGTYSYIRDYNTPGGVQESFDYTIVDQDGSISQATLTIKILNAPDTVNVPDTGDGTQVDEGGLPPRQGDGTPGTGEIADDIPDNNSDQSETTGSTITFNSPDGVGSITVDGTPIDLDGPFPQTVVDNDKGTLVVTDYTYDPVTGDGTVTYEYTLGDNTSGDDTSVSFEIIVTDLDGDEAPGDLVIDIIDDQPIARPDVDSVTEGATATGNVLTGEGTQGGTNGVGMDTPGADGFGVAPNGTVTGIESENVPANSDFEANGSGAFVVAGAYGTLTIYRDGSYSYKSNPDTIGEAQQDVFTYHIVDGDGSPAEATLTINLRPVTLEADNDTVTVDEAALDLVADDRAPSGTSLNDDLAAGAATGSSPESGSETVTGQLSVADAVSYALDAGQSGTYGQIKINSDGSYTYTLTQPVDGDSLDPSQGGDNADNTYSGIETFTYTATDANGNTVHGTITIDVIDDVPTARDDYDSVTQGAISTDGNVITGDGTDDGLGGLGADTKGADGASVTTTGTFEGTYGDLVLNANGSYTYTLNDLGKALIQTLDENETLEDTFDYTLTDGDGDTSDAVLTVVLKGTDDGVTITGFNANADVPEVILDEDDLANIGDDQGSDQSDPLSYDKSFTVNAPDGLGSVTVGGITVATGGDYVGGTVLVINDGVYKVEITGWHPTYALSGDSSTPVVSATFDYTVTLLDNTLAHTGADDFDLTHTLAVHATDQDTDFADDALDVQIVDDLPQARPDEDSVTEGSISTDGNVISGLGTDGGEGGIGADTTGADGASVSTTGIFHGTYGDLDLSANGDYTYTLNDLGKALIETLDENETLEDVFDYTLTDNDGDESPSTLTITLNGTDDGVEILGFNPDAQAPEVILDEDDLANIGDDQGSDQSDPLSYDKTFTVNAPDGLGSVTVGGITVATGGDYVGGTVLVVNDGVYKVEITGWHPTYALSGDSSTPVVSATFDYTVTLLDNTLAHTGANDFDLTHTLAVHATDEDNDFADDALDVQIVDDIPDASDNANGVDEGQTVGGDLLTDDDGDGVDVSGADGYNAAGAVISIRTEDNSQTDASYDVDGNLEIETALGILTVNKDGTYTYESKTNSTNSDTSETFYYTIKDGDGDTSEAKLVIDITNAAGKVSDEDLEVNEAGLDTATYQGTDAGDGSAQASGSVTVTGASGTLVYVLDSAPAGAYGTLTWDGNGGYTYTLTKPYTDSVIENTTNTVEDADSFAYHVEDTDGNIIGGGTIYIDIVDDVPTARDDFDSVTEGSLATDGNVITGTGTDDGTDGAGSDTPGADGAEVTTTGTFHGTYGDLVLGADGGYTYTLNALGTALIETLDDNETLQDQFDYTLTDSDGDYSPATLTIVLKGTDDGVTITGLNGDVNVPEEILDEDDLSDGSTPDAPALVQTGTFGVTSPDGMDDVTAGTTDIVVNGVFQGAQEVANDGVYKVEITGWTPVYAVAGDNTTPVISATFSYKVTLLDNTLVHDELGQDDIVKMLAIHATDQDGDFDDDVLDTRIIDDVPTARPDGDSVTEDTGTSTTGNVITGSGTAGGLNGVGADTKGADGAAISGVAAGSLAGPVSGNVGTTINGLYGTLNLAADGSYTYTLYTQGQNPTAYATVQALDETESLTDEVFSYTLKDGDNDISTTTLTITVNGTNDAPVPVADSGTLSDEGLPGGNPDNVGTPTDASDSKSDSGQITITDVDDSTFTVTFGTPSTTLGGNTVVWTPSNGGHTLTGSIGGTPTIQLTIDNLGNWTATLLAAIPHSTAGVEDVISGFVIPVSVSDGTTSVGSSITLAFEDDSPVNFSPVDLTDTNGTTGTTQDDALVNDGTASATRLLNDPNNDGIGSNFIGGDGFGSLEFTGGTDGVTTLVSTGGDPITAGGGDTIYLFGFGTDTLIGTTDSTNTDASQKVFTVTLDPGTGAGNDATYTIDFDRALDDGSGTVLSDFGAINPNNYDWVGFTSEGDLFDGIDNDGEDILITAYNSTTKVAGTVNMSSSDIGSNNQWMDANESLRIDFVTDGTGAGSEKTPKAYSFDGHYAVTNASFSIIEVKSNGTNAAVKVTLYNDDDSGTLQDLNGSTVHIAAGSVIVTDSGGNDITGTGAIVTYNGDGTITVTGLAPGDNIAFAGDTVFNAFDVAHAGGNDFSLGYFGFTSELSGNDQTFAFDVLATDSDGDTSTGTIDITVSPASVTPIVLDMDVANDNPLFSGIEAGIAYDYDGDGVKTQTAWIAAGAAILAYDANQDGFVTDASEFVFGHDDLTDLEALAAEYDTNLDGVLTADDSTYSQFGIWLDSNLDGNADEGEFVSLADAGIKSIDLVSDGLSYTAVGGDVEVSGHASYVMEDGTVGTVADAAFATGSEIDGAMMEALLAMADAPEGDAVLVTQDQPDVQAVVADALVEDAVDAVVADYSDTDGGTAGAPDAPVLAADDGSHAALEALLYSNIGDGEGSRIHDYVTIDQMDDASMAVVAQA